MELIIDDNGTDARRREIEGVATVAIAEVTRLRSMDVESPVVVIVAQTLARAAATGCAPFTTYSAPRAMCVLHTNDETGRGILRALDVKSEETVTVVGMTARKFLAVVAPWVTMETGHNDERHPDAPLVVAILDGKASAIRLGRGALRGALVRDCTAGAA